MDQKLIEKTNKLKLYLCCMNLSATEFAKTLDLSAAMISGYLAGTRRVSKRVARLIEYGTEGIVTKDDVLKYNPEKKLKEKDRD